MAVDAGAPFGSSRYRVEHYCRRFIATKRGLTVQPALTPFSVRFPLGLARNGLRRKTPIGLGIFGVETGL